MSDIFVYHWTNFTLHNSGNSETNECDAEYDEQQNSNMGIVETRFKDVLPLKYGFYYKGMNYIQIYPYMKIGKIVYLDSYVFMNGKRMKRNDSIGLYLPYQDKRLAKKLSVERLQKCHYDFEAEVLKSSPVYTRSPIHFSDGHRREFYSEAKRIDNKMWEGRKIIE